MKLSALLTLLFFTIVFSANAQFVTIWDTTIPGITSNTQISIDRSNVTNFTYTYFNLATSATGSGPSGTTVHVVINLPTPGRYRITFSGAGFNNIIMGGNGDGNKLESIEAWGNTAWTSMANAFSGCERLRVNATDSPNLTNVTSMRQMFEDATAVTGAGFENWNVGNVQDFTNTFALAMTFNGAIGVWDMHSATDLTGMFAAADAFDQDISNWNVSNVTSLQNTFRASGFNHNINNWNVSNVNNMIGTFSRTTSFNQPLNNWNVANVTDMDQMFSEALSFNQNINNWNVGNCNNFAEMFYAAQEFNQPLNNWNMSSCVYPAGMFQDAVKFNQPIGNWNMSKCQALDRMFAGATAFNQDIGGWDVHNAITMNDLFHNAFSFNQDLSFWNTTNCISMSEMFMGASSFTSNIQTWNTANVLDMGYMFKDAANFNGDITGWDVSKVATMSGMFHGASTFNQNLSKWNIGQVTDMSDIFHNSGLSDDNYDNTLIGWAALPSVQDDVTIGAQTNSFCKSKAAHAFLDNDKNWFFFDKGLYCVPIITSFSPTSQAEDGVVVIKGFRFTGATSVSFGDVDADEFTVIDDNTINATVADGDSGTVAITTPDGTGTMNGFIFIETPKVLSYSPVEGPAGTVVTITGKLFTNASAVSFGGVAATSFTVVDANTITAVVGNGASGSVSVTAGGIVASLPGFTFTGPVGPQPAAQIVFKNGDNNTGSVIKNLDVIDLGITAQNVALVKTFSIANTGNAAANVVSIFVGQGFEIIEYPTVINPNSFGKLTLSIIGGIPADYTTNVIITFTDGSRFEFVVKAAVERGGIIVYNAVTPNGDGAHDFLHVLNIESYPGNKVVILDRLGNEVFTMNDYDNSTSSKRFEGVSNKGGGRNLTDGTYYYIIDVNTNKKYTGFLLLQR